MRAKTEQGNKFNANRTLRTPTSPFGLGKSKQQLDEQTWTTRTQHGKLGDYKTQNHSKQAETIHWSRTQTSTTINSVVMTRKQLDCRLKIHYINRNSKTVQERCKLNDIYSTNPRTRESESTKLSTTKHSENSETHSKIHIKNSILTQHDTQTLLQQITTRPSSKISTMKLKSGTLNNWDSNIATNKETQTLKLNQWTINRPANQN